MSGGAARELSRAARGLAILASMASSALAAGCSARATSARADESKLARPGATPAATLRTETAWKHKVVLVSVGTRQLPALVVPGADAMATSTQLRASAEATGQYPIIVGEYSRAAQYLASVHLAISPREVLMRSESVALDPADWEGGRTRPRESNTELEALLNRVDEYHARERSRVLQITELPEEPMPPVDIIGHWNMLQGIPFATVLIVLIPSNVGWQAPAFLGFGGFGRCPEPEQHVRILRHWYERYGAEVVTVGADLLELEVENPPRERDQALALARVQYDYCPDIAARQGATLGAMAASLLSSKIWRFWWN